MQLENERSMVRQRVPLDDGVLQVEEIAVRRIQPLLHKSHVRGGS
jgi:hypothetical protein